MIPDQTRMLDNLNRTARTAGHDTILETWKLRRLLAAAELAEAVMEVRDAAELIDATAERRAEWHKATARRDRAAKDYKLARESEIR